MSSLRNFRVRVNVEGDESILVVAAHNYTVGEHATEFYNREHGINTTVTTFINRNIVRIDGEKGTA